MGIVLIIFVAGTAGLLLDRLYASWTKDLRPRNLPNAYVLSNKVTHARLLPTESAHRFTYHTLSLFVSLDALEKHKLDLGYGWLFSYGGLLCRISGLRSEAYLESNSPRAKDSIKQKLARLIESRGYDSNKMRDVWMLTMPSYLGYEGINPLTVYNCYTATNDLWLVILEIHNTFGEQHVHVLDVQINQKESPIEGFDYQWTFHRQFHVSPFNDRSGFYKVSVTAPRHPPSNIPPYTADDHSTEISPPLPRIQIHLHTESDDPTTPTEVGPLKLTASLYSITSVPFTSWNWTKALVQQPFALFLSLPRIFYQAWILHYRKSLDVYARPDPLPVPSDVAEWEADRHASSRINGCGVGWRPETLLEGFSRKRVESFLQSRANATRTTIALVPGTPHVPIKTFHPLQAQGQQPQAEVYPELTVRYRSPRFFTSWLLSPSAKHLLLLKDDIEGTFDVSSEQLFESVLSHPPSSLNSSSSTVPSFETSPSRAQCLRMSLLPSSLLHDPHFPIPPFGPIDRLPPLNNLTSDIGLLLALLPAIALHHLEKWAFSLFSARVVPGQEPWLRWESAYARAQNSRSASEMSGELKEHSLADATNRYKLGSHGRHDVTV